MAEGERLNPARTALVVGLFFGLAYLKTGSLWFPIGFHAAWDFCQGCIFSLPVSGAKVFRLLDVGITGSPLVTGGAFGGEGVEADLGAVDCRGGEAGDRAPLGGAAFGDGSMRNGTAGSLSPGLAKWLWGSSCGYPFTGRW